jgi:hypothetical protein
MGSKRDTPPVTAHVLEVKVDLTSNDEAMARKIAQTIAEKVLASE